MLKVKDRAPLFSLPNEDGKIISLAELNANYTLLYFYPKDDTDGCTKQACSFSDHKDIFNKIGMHVIGISKDTVISHRKFIDKYGIKITLLSDTDSTVCSKYGVLKEKNMFGRKYLGIDRTSFLIDRNGLIAYIWYKVKIDGHVDSVLKMANF